LNILTKICVVVLLVLVLVASVVFINMATVPLNYRELYVAAKTEAALASQDARTQKLVANRLTEEVNSLGTEVARLETQLTEAKVAAEPSAADTRTKQLVQQLEEVKTRLGEQALTIKAMGERNTLLSGQLKDARDRIAEQQQKYAEQSGKLTEIAGKLQRSERVVGALEQQLRDRKERIDELEKQLESPGAAAAGTAIAAAPRGQVTGTITAVRGENASINVGAAQGVGLGQKYYIYRNAKFVGYLRIDEVNEGEAAGLVVDKQLDPVIGDKVANNLK